MAAFGTVAVVCILVGVLISSSLHLPPASQAQVPTNVAQTGLFPVAEHDGRLESPFVSVVEQVADAVVNISAKVRDVERPWWYRGTHYATSLGSGFFFREDGYILTNNHVIQDAIEMTVRTATGYEYEARLVGADPETDLAVIKVIPEEKISVIPFGESDEVKVGDWAIAIGNPFPQQGLDRTVTVGVVSAKGRSALSFGRETPQYQNYIQTDAAINPGNSGGPLLNLRGECIGVNAAITSPTGTSIGIGFAIPIDLARAIVPDLIAHGKPSRGWLGVWLSDVTEHDAKRYGLEAVRGVHIDSVLDNSPASRAGLRMGDIVEKFDNHDIKDAAEFQVLVSTVKAGSDVIMQVMRKGERLTLKTRVGDRDTYLASSDYRTQAGQDQSEVWLGMELIDFTEEIANAIGADHVEGVYVVRVYPGTPADRASITEGTVILKIDNQAAKTIQEVRRIAAETAASKTRLPLIVQEPDGAIARKVIRR